LSDRFCIRGCTIRGEHYAACPDFGSGNYLPSCRGCAPVAARDGALICERCYSRLRRALEAAPDLVALLRSLADPLKAQVFDRVMVQGSGSSASPAPVPADLLDAVRDIMQTLGGPQLAPGASSLEGYRAALAAVGDVLDQLDVIANDAEAIVDWCEVVLSPSLDGSPEFWTIARALQRWPLEDRRRWARSPCPECGLRAVKVTPPRHRKALTWFACSNCGWRKNENDDDGLWAAAFGQHAEADDERSTTMGAETLAPKDIDISEALKAGTEYVLAHPGEVERAGALGPFAAFLVGAMPALAEQFASVAEQIASDVRHRYENGTLIAGGARITAAAIRAAVEGSGALERIAGDLADAAQPDAEASE
jgi:predicted RNA-binding Zn-ribbon protein involved in translation (DUF1610 family)